MATMRDIGGEVPTEVEIIESRFYHEATALLATKEILQTCRMAKLESPQWANGCYGWPI